MKKSLQFVLIFALLINTFYAFSQGVCGSVFTDSGGLNGSYSNSENVTTTICPDNPGELVKITFTSFNIENNFDFLKVYDGSSPNAPLIGTYTGTNIPIIQSTAADGCLTFVFTSDSVINLTGWIANVTCVPQSSCLVPSGLSTVVSTNNVSLNWTENGSATEWEVLIQTSGTTPPTSANTGINTSTKPYTISGLSQGTSYNVYVRSICSSGDLSQWSNASSFTNVFSCTSPNQFSTANQTQTSIDINWSNIPNISGYEYAVQLASITTNPTSGTFNSTNNISIANLTPGTSYKIRVRTICSPNSTSQWVAYYFNTLSTPQPTPVCGGSFIDNGGISGNYNTSSDSTVTIYPTVAGEFVTVDFLTFDTEANWDGLYIYNGNSTNAPQISSDNPGGSVPGGLPGAFWGTDSPGTVTSTSVDGSLTFRFISDSAINRAGWNAYVICGPPLTCPKPTSIIVSNINTFSANFAWTENGSATQWEVLILPAGTFPNSTSVGTLTSTSTFLATNLSINTQYNFFVRSICSASDLSFWSTVKSFKTAICAPPTQITASAITQNTALISWANTFGQYEIIVQLSTTIAPTATSVGTLLSVNSYQVNGLLSLKQYRAYLRLICDTSNKSAWSSYSFTILDNVLTTGAPLNVVECADNLTSCFDLTSNNSSILANLDPSLYTIRYFASQANANSGISPIVAPVCFSNATRTYYVVLTQISTGLTQSFNFYINTRTVNSTVVLFKLTECNNTQGTIVNFNLSEITSQINSTNNLEYYTTLINATTGTSQITSINSYPVNTTVPITTIFVKEIIANACDNIFSFQLVVYSDCSLGYTCLEANSLCGKLGIPFANTHQNITADPGNSYGCLGSQPNPTWFYLPISDPGTLNLTIQQSTDINFATNNLDVDYIVYGPFSNPTTPCATAFTTANIVACSFSGAPVEYPIIPNAITGQYYLLMVTNFSNNAGYIKITTATTSTAAIDCSGMRLNAFLDANTNGIKDVGEVNFPLGQFHHEMNSSGIIHNITNHGVYNIYDNNSANLYNVNYTIDPNYTTQYGLTASSYTNISTSNSGMVTYYFPVTIIDYYKDLSVVVLPYTAPRAGAIYKNKVVYTNLGSLTVVSGTVTFNNDASTTITAISEPSAVPIANGFTYDYSNLAPFESRVIDVTMSVPPIPTVAINQLLTNTASILPINNDLVPANNYSQTTSAIIAAYDPNDKVEAHGEKILISSFNANDYLTYTIRFENTGNAYAINVNVTDELDAKIDETSIKMIAASHNYTLDRVGSNLSWNFENIQLPVSVPNTEIGKGYITFKAKLKPGFTVGTVVPNTAKIYFDSNPPIITNTFNTEFVTVLATDDFNQNTFRIYPNPVQNSLTIITNQTIEIKELNIYNTLGQLVQTIKNPNKTIDVSSLQTGNYLLKIITDNGVNIQKFNKE